VCGWVCVGGGLAYACVRVRMCGTREKERVWNVAQAI